MSRAQRRIQKEREKFEKDPSGMILRVESDLKWLVTIVGAEKSLYEGETHTLEVTFDEAYPMEPPMIVFTAPGPDHEHVYTNGHICLNILYDEWSPALTVSSVCMSILSMLSSATEKTRPSDNARYTARGRDNPKKTIWAYHDDSV